MELNPRLIYNYRSPKLLFQHTSRSPLVKLIVSNDTGSKEFGSVIKFKVHKYTSKKGRNYTVPCLSDHISCPHCENLNTSTTELYAFSIDHDVVYNYKSGEVHDNCHILEPDYSEICLLSFCTEHKHAYDVNSFINLGVYPVSLITGAESQIKNDYNIAKNSIVTF